MSRNLLREEIETLYRRYWLEVRKFQPFPMELTYDNVLDFSEWLLTEITIRAQAVIDSQELPYPSEEPTR